FARRSAASTAFRSTTSTCGYRPVARRLADRVERECAAARWRLQRRARSKAGAKGEECVGKRRPPRATTIEQLPCQALSGTRRLRLPAPEHIGSDAPRDFRARGPPL